MRKLLSAALSILSLFMLLQGAAYAATFEDVNNDADIGTETGTGTETGYTYIITVNDVSLDLDEIKDISDEELQALILQRSELSVRDADGQTAEYGKITADYSAVRREVNLEGYPVVFSIPLSEGQTPTIDFLVYVTSTEPSTTPTSEPTPTPSSEPTPVPTPEPTPVPTHVPTPDPVPAAPVVTPKPKPIPTPRPTLPGLPENTPSPEPTQKQEPVSEIEDIDNTHSDKGKEETNVIAGIVIFTEFTATGMLGVGIVSDLRLLKWYEKKMRK